MDVVCLASLRHCSSQPGSLFQGPFRVIFRYAAGFPNVSQLTGLLYFTVSQ